MGSPRFAKRVWSCTSPLLESMGMTAPLGSVIARAGEGVRRRPSAAAEAEAR
jgi:hypothetical protein